MLPIKQGCNRLNSYQESSFLEKIESNNIDFLSVKKEVVTAAENYVLKAGENFSPEWNRAKVKFEFPLYDFDENITSYLFTVIDHDNKERGYIIVSASENPVVIESTREGVHPYNNYKISSKDRAIYVGPTMHYIKQDKPDSYLDIRENKKIEKANLKSKGPLTGDNVKSIKPQVEEGIGTLSIISYASKILPVHDMNWYIGCSPTSFGNIVRFWDGNGKPNLVQSTTTDNTLIDALATDMKTNRTTGATDWNNRVTGMVNFWKARGYNVSVTRTSPSFTNYRTEIVNGRPSIVNVVNDPTYKSHDMTGVGYEQYQETSEGNKWYQYVIVHDTWSTTPKDVYLYVGNLSSWYETVKVVPQ